jgi:hypothetical protein
MNSLAFFFLFFSINTHTHFFQLAHFFTPKSKLTWFILQNTPTLCKKFQHISHFQTHNFTSSFSSILCTHTHTPSTQLTHSYHIHFSTLLYHTHIHISTTHSHTTSNTLSSLLPKTHLSSLIRTNTDFIFKLSY